MLSVIYFLLVLLFKLFLLSIFLLVVLAVGLRLWIEPLKGVCMCSAKLHGKVALVTGGNSGIGLETARNLARRGARVIIASRNSQKSEQAVANIIATTKNENVEYRYLDLSKFSSIKKFAEHFNDTVDRLDILVNNAGCAGIKQALTEDGIDLVMQINYLGPFLLTNLLLNKLIASRPSRIVNVSSYAQHFAKLNPNDLAGHQVEGYWARYSNSKLCQVLWTKALAKKLPSGVTVNALHPGVVRTEIFNKLPSYYKILCLNVIDLLFKTPKEGAQTTIHLCVSPALEFATGGYYQDCRPCKAAKAVEDMDLIEQVWNNSLLLTEDK